jgi:hypothetical protein
MTRDPDFAARSLARDAKKAERERRRAHQPFSIDDLPPGLEMVRTPKGNWTIRPVRPSRPFLYTANTKAAGMTGQCRQRAYRNRRARS